MSAFMSHFVFASRTLVLLSVLLLVAFRPATAGTPHVMDAPSPAAPLQADTTASDSSAATPSASSYTPEVCAIGCKPIPARRDYRPSPRRATLAYWSRTRRLMVLDREHSFGDRYFDRGVFRHRTPRIDREYDMDMMAYRFRPAEDARWLQAAGGIRVRAGSVERDLWAIKTEIRNTVPFGEDSSHLFSIEGILQEDPQSSRSLLEMSYGYAISPKHAVGVRHTFSRYKYDLDVTPFYAYASPGWGRAEVAVTFLDTYSNFIYEQLGINTDVLDVVRTYDQKPYLFEIQYASPERYRLGGEVTLGWQTRSRSTFDSQLSSFQFSQSERTHYASALLEYRLRETLAVGAYFKRDASRLSRFSSRDTLSTDYSNQQTHQRIGAYVRGEWERVRSEVYAFTGYYDDAQQGDGFDTSIIGQAFDLDTEMRALSARMVYDAQGWPYFGLQYIRFRRDLNVPRTTVLASQWTRRFYSAGPNHDRLVGLIGHRFGRGSVAMGIGLDLDGDPIRYLDDETPKYFDNGFFQFAMTW